MAHTEPLFFEDDYSCITGLRGALALALALGLPSTVLHSQEIVSAAFAVVGFSVFVQGLTITPLLRRTRQI